MDWNHPSFFGASWTKVMFHKNVGIIDILSWLCWLFTVVWCNTDNVQCDCFPPPFIFSYKSQGALSYSLYPLVVLFWTSSHSQRPSPKNHSANEDLNWCLTMLNSENCNRWITPRRNGNNENSVISNSISLPLRRQIIEDRREHRKQHKLQNYNDYSFVIYVSGTLPFQPTWH